MEDKLNHILNPEKGISVLYGEGGTGKTCFMLVKSFEILRQGKRVLFIDTENSFSLERFIQIAGKDYVKYLDNLIYIKVKSFNGQHRQILHLNEDDIKSISLIVMDSISNFFRILLSKKKDLARAMMIKQMRHLKILARKTPVLLTNQVYYNINDKKINMVGEDIFKNFCNIQIRLVNERGFRRLIIEKPIKKEILFNIIGSGIEIYNDKTKQE